MESISDIFGFNKTMNLSKGNYESGVPSVKKTESVFKRVPKQELFRQYITNPTTFNAINKNTQIILSSKFYFEGNPDSVKELESFTKNMGFTGNDVDWETIRTSLFKSPQICGWCPIEKILDKDGFKIVDLGLISPSKFDYAKDINGNIVYDEYNRSVGYTIDYGANFNVESKYELPKGVHLDTGQQFIIKEKVALPKLYSIEDDPYPIGLVEPAYNTSIRKQDSEEGFAQANHKSGFPLIIDRYGDRENTPTPNKIKESTKNIKDIHYNSSIVIPYYEELSLLESKSNNNQKDYLDYYTTQEISAYGSIKALVTGGGESNLGAIKYLMPQYRQTLKDIVDGVLKALNNQVFLPYLEQRGMKPAYYTYSNLFEEKDSLSKRLGTYVKNGLLTPSPELTDYILKIEGIDLKGDEK